MKSWVCLVLLLFATGAGTRAWAADAWSAVPGGRSRPLIPASGQTPGFTVMDGEETGFVFTNRLAASRFVTNQIHLNGSGVALGDVDGDGWCDIFLAGLDGGNALWRNLGGWKFANVAAQAGVELASLDATGAAFADLDGDGDLDLLLNTIGAGTQVLLNDGRMHFGPAPGSPFNKGRGGMSLAVADSDGDGDLDVYVANYRTDTFRDQPGTRFRGKNVGGRMVLQTVNGRPISEPDLVGRYTILPTGTIQEHGEGDLFLRNEGGGRFAALALTDDLFMDDSGKPLSEPLFDWTLAVMFRDLNGDRAPDLYVCNDFQDEDRFWLNDGQGRFRPAPALALRHVSMFSMAIGVADLDRDGFDDLFTADMLSRTHERRHTKLGDVRPQYSPPGVITNRPQYSFNQLHRGRGDGTFADVAWYAGLEASDWTWNVLLLDVDMDGFEDVLMATGHELDWMDSDLWEKTEQIRARRDLPVAEVQKLKQMFPRLNIANFAFRNEGQLRFAEVGSAWHFDLPIITHGMASADLDNDGDADVVLNNLNDPATLLRNDATAPRLAVRLRGNPPNTFGIGAKIRVSGGPVPQSQEMMAGGHYLSSDDPSCSFATGTSTNLSLEVTWRAGRVSRVAHARPGFLYEISEADAVAPITNPPAPAKALFFTHPLAHVHVDEPFDDFAVQALLPNRLSQLGPGIVCRDFDADGQDDLVLGSGRGGMPAFFHNESGQLRPWPGAATRQVTGRDTLGVVAWPMTNRPGAVLLAFANWEDSSTNGAAIQLLRPGESSGTEILPAGVSSPGSLTTGDFDGDGDLDVFLGGRCVSGRYPASAESGVFINERGSLHAAGWNRVLFDNLGMVTGATWSDLLGDGFPELIVASDWGPLHIFLNERGRLSPWDAPWTNLDTAGGSGGAGKMSTLTGCWTGLATVDLNSDGRLDLVVGNWGLNSRWQLARERPLRLYFGDYDDNGGNELMEAVFVPQLGDYAPLRTLRSVAAALPFVREIAPDHQAFSRCTVARILGTRMARTRHVEAATLTTVALLNQRDHFDLRPLPAEAQWAPVFAVVPGDFDGDGHEDVFLSQNFFGVQGDTYRQDAGRGLLLRGDGHGTLQPVPGAESGLEIYGEQRGAATADFDGDARSDLVVSQNGAPTRLYLNAGARPGVRVRLQGPPGNPAGVGALVRLRSVDRLGPVRAVDGGSGWLSQNSPVLVMAHVQSPSAVEVLWPGGVLAQVPIPNGALEVVISADGR